MNLADDVFFSPVRDSDSDSSCDFENTSNVPCCDMTVTFLTASKKHVSEHKAKCDKGTNELGSCSSESSFALKPGDTSICTPALEKHSARLKSDSKFQLLDFNKGKLEKKKHSKDNIKRDASTKITEGHAKKQDCQQSEAAAICDAVKSNIKQNVKKGSLRPTSLLLRKKEDSKCSATKELKKEKNVTESSKNVTNLDMPVSNTKHSKKNLLGDSLEARSKNFDASDERTTDSINSKSLNYNLSNSKSDTSNKKSCLDQNINSKSTSNMPVNTPFEISVEKMVSDAISFECDKMRQHIYAQQMSFYRELNKVKAEMDRQHLEDTARLLGTIEQLAQINSDLKSNS